MSDSVRWSRFAAVIFDLDGVVTSTARLHATAWKATFDECLQQIAPDQQPFDIGGDYRAHVDGRIREDGVTRFLESRDLRLPLGDISDSPGCGTVRAVGNAKNARFLELLQAGGADAFADALELLRHLESLQIPVAIASSSANCSAVLESVGLADRFPIQVDGLVASELGLASKPAPDVFIEAARRLGVTPARCVVLEDAVSGVMAGRVGGFGLVIGVDRETSAGDLHHAGADLVVTDLTDLVADDADWASYPFDPEPWGLTRDGLHPDHVAIDESLFALGNGNLGVRGAFEQGAPWHEPGAMLNGFHETWPIVYPEPAFGYASLGQTILALPEAGGVRLSWNGALLDLSAARVRRRLDFRTGILTTTATWAALEARWDRLVSLSHPEVLAQRVTVDVKQKGTLGITTRVVNRQDLERSGQDVQVFEPDEGVDPRLAPVFGRRVLEPRDQVAEGNTCVLAYRTTSSDLPLAVASRFDASLATAGWSLDNGDLAGLSATASSGPGDRHTSEVIVAYRRDEDASAALEYVRELGDFAALAADQVSVLDDLWATSDIEIVGDPTAQQAVRYAILQMHWASAALQNRGVPARGLSGRSYEGHHFWDTDVFLMPFLAATHPKAAVEILRYRYGMLPKARERAAELSLDGALFPWRTITGDEASAYFPAGTAQYHINADVLWGLDRYLKWTGDDETLWAWGVEMAVETARMWASLGFWDDDGFHVHGVTGPDEYTVLVNDNAYTNQMARMSLRFAVSTVQRMRAEQRSRYDALAAAIDLDDAEVVEWERIAAGMVIVTDEKLGITAQDATFTSLRPWDWGRVPGDQYPLLLHFHPLVLYRHQVLKQADVVMAHFLLPEDTPLDRRRADFDHYDPITTGDSSLSPAIQAAVAAQVGRHSRAWTHFQHAASLDLANLAGNTRGGIHLAAAAGVWLAVVEGFAGVRLREGGIITAPALPKAWESVTINLEVRGQHRRVEVERSNGT